MRNFNYNDDYEDEDDDYRLPNYEIPLDDDDNKIEIANF